MKTILLSLLFALNLNAQFTHSYDSTGKLIIAKINTYQCWAETEDKILRRYTVLAENERLVTDYENVACYKNTKNSQMIVVDTMTAIRLLYLDVLQKEKEISKLWRQCVELEEIISSCWYNPSDPKNKKFSKLITEYSEKYQIQVKTKTESYTSKNIVNE